MFLFSSSGPIGLPGRFSALCGVRLNFDKVVTFGREDYVECVNASVRGLRVIGAGAARLAKGPQSSLFGGGT
ncbi:hypothetical protein [Sulfitobacter sp. 1A12157]|uniref:hypothetical protein n=1 Tax=Sulfitobacter sp. 1A12157 TaxID=3368594 RepID=UPI00374715C9